MAARVYATIGRAPDNDLVLDHPTVSNHHARLSWQGTSLLVEDLSSANGTFVDERPIKAAKTRPGAHVRVGEVSLPWSHEGLRTLLKAGVGARTLVISAHGAQSYVCGNCGQVSQLPHGPVPNKLSCPGCGASLKTATKPKGSGSKLLPVLCAVLVCGLGAGALVRLLTRPPNALSSAAPLAGASRAAADETEPVGGVTALKLAAAINPMDPLTRNTAVQIAARKEGPFHVEQVAEIWGAVRKPWHYVNDPEGREYFATAKETIENGYSGDCDDFAITLVSMVTAIGGKARVVLMDGPRGGHAYAEACVQGEPAKVASALAKHYKSSFKRYIGGAAPKQIAYRSSDECPIWLNLDWNSVVPGGAYEPELWAVAIYEGGKRELLVPANPVVGQRTEKTPASQTPAP